MAPDEARALITRYYAAFNAFDFEGMLACLHPDVVHDVNQSGRETGIAAFRAFLARMDGAYREQLSEIRILVAADGAHAAAEYVVSGTYLKTDDGLPPATGQSYRLPGAAFFDIRDARIARVSNHYNLNDWLRQVGA